MPEMSRRTFLDGLAVTLAGTALAAPARSYAQIVGANDRVNFATAGLNGRGRAHLSAIANNGKTARMTHCCDVDAHVLAKFGPEAEKTLGYAPDGEPGLPQGARFEGCRCDYDCDARTTGIRRWLCSVCGRESTCTWRSLRSHNPREGELLVEAQKKYGKLVQVGDQQRSSPHTIKIVQQIHDGLIGRAYYAKTWYSNPRKSMGIGKPAPVPEWLDWDLWQGPAPRTGYVDNVHPYNWHWLTRYGTGEALNNGTHEVDIARWALGVDMPERVNAAGSRYAYKDDWQFPDTMVTNFEYPDHMISWEGLSANGMKDYGRDRGILVHGTTGSVLVDRTGYEVYDWNGKKIDEFDATKDRASSNDLLSRDSMTDAHFANFIAGIRTGEPLHSPDYRGECQRDHAAALEHCVARESRVESRHGKRPHPERRRSDEAVGTRVSAGLGG